MPRFTENITANGSTSARKYPNKFTLFGKGTWDSGSAQLQVSHDDGTTWIDVTGITLTQDGYKDVELNALEPLNYRVTVSSIASAADLYFTIV